MTLKWVIRGMTSRFFTITLLIVIQLSFFVSSILLISDQTLFSVLLRVISLSVVIWISVKRDNPSYKLAWTVMILSLPVLGGLFYLLWGNKRLPRGFRHRIDDFYHANLAHIQVDSGCGPELQAIDNDAAMLSGYLKRHTGFPAWRNTTSEHFALGDTSYPRMVEELRKAQRFILMEYFIITPGHMWENILDVLQERQRAGVEVKIMYDDLGTINTLPRGYDRTLRSMGFEVTVFNPYKPHLNLSMNYRDHRKICVIDGNVAFCGGANIADEYINRKARYGHWKDTGVMLMGDGVWNLTLMFLALWNFSNPGTSLEYGNYVPTVSADGDGFVQPFGDSPLDNLDVTRTVYLQIINRANRYLYLTTPYLIPDNELITALSIAAQSGVDVRILTPHIPDKWYIHIMSRSYYRVLLEAGVRIFEYLPGFIHAKQLVCDDDVALVGTANLDFRSLYLNFECGVCFYHSSTVHEVRDDILGTLTVCHEVTDDEALSFPLWKRILAAALRIFAPLF